MNYWLVKSEPYEYSYDDLESDGKTRWVGVRNYAARNHMRDMEKGDRVFYYHSREGLEIVGIARVVKDSYPDPTADEGDWSAVDLEPVKRLEHPVSLKEIKKQPELQEMALVRNSRLSVMPVEEEHWEKILDMSGS
ncbi:MAG: EVE domain-containing protein [Saprospiraceae bacterium]|nr:EVE domain-containing protein [Saprospiraceae bacterium]